MTVLALKLSRRANAVSSLHGQVSRAMWAAFYPDRSEEEVPIGHITNGVHVHSWLAPQMRQVYDRHLGPDWPARCSDCELWEAIDDGGRRRALGNAPGPEATADRSGATPGGRAGRASAANPPRPWRRSAEP